VRAQGRLRALDNFWASRSQRQEIFMVSDSCKVVVFDPDTGLEPFAVNDLDDQCSATPAIADRKIYIRTPALTHSAHRQPRHRAERHRRHPRTRRCLAPRVNLGFTDLFPASLGDRTHCFAPRTKMTPMAGAS
jgi:hypothetical protein